MSVFIVLLGPPGAGKGTQAKVVSQRMGLPHISSGEIFRENIKNQTALGKLAKGYIDRGELVPDDVTIPIIQERLSRPDCKPGALLDGFPRTPAQAEALERILLQFMGDIAIVPYISVPEDVLVSRLTGRWTCRAGAHVFHEQFNPPQRTGTCDYDGSGLYQRDDDKSGTVSQRIRVYLQQTLPLIEYYKMQGKLFEVDGTLPINQVSSVLLEELSRIVTG